MNTIIEKEREYKAISKKKKTKNKKEMAWEYFHALNSMLGFSKEREYIIRENWHLHKGEWPEMTARFQENFVFKEEDGNEKEINLNEHMEHHPKINTATNWIVGDIIMQPLIAIVRDFSSYGRKYREQEREKRLKEYYYQNFYEPQASVVQSQVLGELGVTDMNLLSPEESQQVQQAIAQRMKSDLPQGLMEDMKKIKTPDEKIRQILLSYDIINQEIEEKFIEGGEEAVVSFEEYYMVSRNGVKPYLRTLSTENVTFIPAGDSPYSEDGYAAKYRGHLAPHEVIEKYWDQIKKDPDFMDKARKAFSKLPDSKFQIDKGRRANDEGYESMEKEADFRFIETVGGIDNILKNSWKTKEGQNDVWAVYNMLSTSWNNGFALEETYITWRWLEDVTYVVREIDGEEVELTFASTYREDKTVDILCEKRQIYRVWHGAELGDALCGWIEPVEFQFSSALDDFSSKLTIWGRKYSNNKAGTNYSTLICPAKQFQWKLNLTESKIAELERSDVGKIVVWNDSMRPENIEMGEYLEMALRLKHIPAVKKQIGSNGNEHLFEVADTGIDRRMEVYLSRSALLEDDIFKSMYINKYSLGQTSQYASNALAQNNQMSAAKQLLHFHNKRRMVKQRILNHYLNLSFDCLLKDDEKQNLLLDDFSRSYLQANKSTLRAMPVSTFVVDDYGEANNIQVIKGQILSMLQAGNSMKDVIAIMKSKSTSEMEDIAEVSEMRAAEREQEARAAMEQNAKLQTDSMKEMEQFREELKTIREERSNQVKIQLAQENSSFMEKGNDINQNNISDSLEKAREDIKVKERIEDKKIASDEKIAAMRYNNQNKPK